MNWLGSLQQLGRAVMLPTMALPAAALLLSVGSLPWSAWGMGTLGEIAQAAGHGVFYYMPYLFAIGVAWGLSNQGGPAGLAALAGMFIYDQVISRVGDGSIHPSTLIGIIFGVMSGYVYNRFKHIKLPEAIQFFGGSRFVLLFMGLFSTIFAWMMLRLAPFVQSGLDSFYELTVHMGAFGLFLYGILYRVLTAFGLHHLLNNLYWFQLGSYETEDGTIVQGDLPRFFAGDPTAGDFMAGLFPIMMFALPAIAFAIIQEAREDLKPKVKKTFMRSALVCFLTGVSEQIEFAFLFASPYLYVLHALMLDSPWCLPIHLIFITVFPTRRALLITCSTIIYPRMPG